VKRLLPFIVLLVIFVGGIIAAPILLNPERHRTQITNTLANLFKRPVVVGPLSMGYFPPTLTVAELAIMKSGGAPGFQVASISAPLDWTALFHLKFIPVELQLNGWKLMILRKPDGTWDLEDWFAGMSGVSEDRAAAVNLVSWKEGEIHWSDPEGSVPQELVLSSIEGQWNPRAATIKTSGTFSGLKSTAHLALSASGQFFSSPQWSGDIQLTDQANACAFHIDDKAGVFDIKGMSAQWRLASALTFLKFYGRGAANAPDFASELVLDHWQMHASGNKTNFSFEHSAGISGGLSEIKGNVAAQPGGLLVHAEGAVQNVPVDVLSSVMGENIPLQGKMTQVIQNIQIVLSAKPISTLSGEGYGEITEAQYKIPPASLEKLAKAKIMAYLKKKFPDLEQNGVPVTRLVAHWQAKAGLVSVDNGMLVSTGFKAGLVGKLDLDRLGLDAYLRLQIHEPNPKLARLVPSRYHTQPAFGHLQGTWQEWSLRSVRPSKIPSAIQAQLRKAVTQK
jgi:hypothetical protein